MVVETIHPKLTIDANTADRDEYAAYLDEVIRDCHKHIAMYDAPEDTELRQLYEDKLRAAEEDLRNL